MYAFLWSLVAGSLWRHEDSRCRNWDGTSPVYRHFAHVTSLEIKPIFFQKNWACSKIIMSWANQSMMNAQCYLCQSLDWIHINFTKMCLYQTWCYWLVDVAEHAWLSWKSWLQLQALFELRTITTTTLSSRPHPFFFWITRTFVCSSYQYVN